MRPTGIFRLQCGLTQLAKVQRESFKAPKNTFDKHFPQVRERKKAWEGQDKDQYFRDRFAHVHARQKQKPDSRKKAQDRRRNSGENEEKRNNFSRRESRNPISLERSPFKEYVYGTGPVLAALESGNRLTYGKLHVISTDEGEVNKKIHQLAKERTVEINYNTSRQDLNHLTHNGIHNGYVLETRPIALQDVYGLSGGLATDKKYSMVQKVYNQATTVEASIRPKHKGANSNAFGVYIDQVTDTHNIGAIIRSAYFLGADFLVMSEKNCAKLNPTVAKASAGALDLLPLYNSPKPLEFFQNTAENGWNVVAALPDISKTDKSKQVVLSGLPQLLKDKPTLLVLGNEGEGLRRALIGRCTHGTSLQPPIEQDKLDSLNVSVAAALLMSRFHDFTAFD